MAGNSSGKTSFKSSVWYLACGNWNGTENETRERQPRSQSSARDGWAGRSLPPPAPAGIEATLVGRGWPAGPPADAEAALLCVPDSSIEEACGRSRPEASAARASSATPAAPPASRRSPPRQTAGASVFSIHPLQTIRGDASDLAGAFCAVSGSDREAIDFAEDLARCLGMSPFEVAEERRAAYHAAAAIASNFLVALEESAARAAR